MQMLEIHEEEASRLHVSQRNAPHLPNEVLADIALRLPPDSQISFRLASKNFNAIFTQAERINLYKCFSQEYFLEYQLLTADIDDKDTPLDACTHSDVKDRLEARMREESGYTYLDNTDAPKITINGNEWFCSTPSIHPELGPRFRKHAFYAYKRFEQLNAPAKGNLTRLCERSEKSKRTSEVGLREEDLSRMPTLQLLKDFRAAMLEQCDTVNECLCEHTTEPGHRLLKSRDDLYLALCVHYRVTEKSSLLTPKMRQIREAEEVELSSTRHATMLKSRMMDVLTSICSKARVVYRDLIAAMTPVVQKRVRLPLWRSFSAERLASCNITEGQYTPLLGNYTFYLFLSLPFHKLIDYADSRRIKHAINRQGYKSGSSYETWTRSNWEAYAEYLRHEAQSLDAEPASSFMAFSYSMLFEVGDEDARAMAWKNVAEVIRSCQRVLEYDAAPSKMR
jgi:hypothetical protein